MAERERVEAIHPGIGFLSENPHFAELCRTHGINFIQHDGCDAAHPVNHSRNITGGWVNWWTFNRRGT